MITGVQISEARELLQWTPWHLAQVARVRLSAIQRAEACEGEPTITSEVQEAIQRALEEGGVEIANGGEPGVKLRRSPE